MKNVLRLSLLVVWGVAGVSAEAQNQSYNVVHNWWVNPGPGVVVPIGVVHWRDFEHAWATSPQGAAASWNPLGQPAQFQPYGRDFLFANGQVWNTGGAFVNRGNTLYVGPPWPFVAQNSVVASSGGASANANASVLVNQFVPAAPFWGNTRAWGAAVAPHQGDMAYAFSTSQMTLTGLTVNWRRGRIRWQPLMQSTVGGSAFARGIRRWDPIFFGEPGSVESFFDIYLEESGTATEASLNWENGRLIHTGVSDIHFDIDMTSPYIDPADRGRFKVRTAGGIVVETIASGRFDGLGPTVGSSDQFDLALASDIEFAYSLPGTGDNLELGFAGAGEITAVPEPGTVAVVALGLATLLMRRRR